MRKIRIFPALLLIFAATPVLALSDQPYITAEQADLVDLLPPPPVPGSPEQQQDIAADEQAEAARTPAAEAHAVADAEIGIYRFADVLGPKFAPSAVPTVDAFFRKIGHDTGPAINQVKDCWERRRPFVVDTKLHPPEIMARGTRNNGAYANSAPHGPGSPCLAPEATPEYSYSYPSGHSTFGAMSAILLAGMVPERRTELYRRGWDYGHNRVVGGVHFPTDVEAGWIEATAMVAIMMQNPVFKQDYAEAKAELRHALGLVP